MTGISVGTVCYKTTGRRAGKKVTIVGFEKKTGRAVIQGEAQTLRYCNPAHLWPTGEMEKVSKPADSVAEKKMKEKANKKANSKNNQKNSYKKRKTKSGKKSRKSKKEKVI